MKGLIDCIEDFVKHRLGDARLNQGRICTARQGELPTPFIVDLWYAWLKQNKGVYSFDITSVIPLNFIKSELKIVARK